jgi:hypothetical protein
VSVSNLSSGLLQIRWLVMSFPAPVGCRKVRWSRAGMGKRGGARVIYFNVTDGRIWLLIAYAKAKFDNLPAEFLSRLKAEVERG